MTPARPRHPQEPEDAGQAGARDIPAPAWVENNSDFFHAAPKLSSHNSFPDQS